MTEAILNAFFELGKNIRLKHWPAGDHISADGAEGGTIWYYSASDDELAPDYRLGFNELASEDWEIVG